MKKKLILIVPVIAAIAGAVLLTFVLSQSMAETPSGKIMSIEAYVEQNISTLSPVQASLGGTFFVTDIEAADGAGVVSYEDGHNAYTADFTYTANDIDGIDITSFIVR